jgi:hypothetical protein
VFLGIAPALTAQEPLTRIAPSLLGRAYLINENALQLVALARQGANVRLSGEDSILEVTAANVEAVTAEYERRRETYAAAIRARGFTPVAGEYEVALAHCPEASGAALITLTQQEFVVEGDGRGVVVERTLVVGQGDGSDGAYRSGSVGGSKIELRPFEGSGRGGERGAGCSVVLTPYRRPHVRLERPERLIGSWEGRWDGEFGVRFTITPSGSGYSVLYEWQEYQGAPFDTLTVPCHPSSKDAIRGGSLRIIVEEGGEYGARAVGQFGRTRTARLKRVAGP